MRKSVKPGYYVSHPEKSGELRLLQASKSHDPEIATAAINKLLLQNEHFLKFYITKWLRTKKYDFEYLLQEARIAFFNAIADYDVTIGISIRAYSKFHLMRLGRELFKKSRAINVEDVNTIPETLHEPTFQDESFDLYALLRSAMSSCLSATEHNVVEQHYFLGKKQKDIANEKGCSAARINAVLSTAYNKLKNHLSKGGLIPGFLQFN